MKQWETTKTVIWEERIIHLQVEIEDEHILDYGYEIAEIIDSDGAEERIYACSSCLPSQYARIQEAKGYIDNIIQKETTPHV